MAYCLPTCPKFVLPSTCPGHCQLPLPTVVLSPTLLCVSTHFYYGTITINTRIMSNYLYFQLPTIMPIFCCNVSPPMPSSCSSSCSVSCISPCQQHCCQEHYPPNFLTSHLLSGVSITMCNSL